MSTAILIGLVAAAVLILVALEAGARRGHWNDLCSLAGMGSIYTVLVGTATIAERVGWL